MHNSMDYLIDIVELCRRYKAELVAVSKTKTAEDIIKVYNAGIRDFGENRAQELAQKAPLCPADIRWHFIGHLQQNKVKFISSFVHLIHSIDSLALLEKVEKAGQKHKRILNLLLQIKIAGEETKYGLDEDQAADILKAYVNGEFPHVSFKGFMGMASFTTDMEKVRSEFIQLRELRDRMSNEFGTHTYRFEELSMGMSGDFELALEEGSSIVRIGSLIFGPRE